MLVIEGFQLLRFKSISIQKSITCYSCVARTLLTDISGQGFLRFLRCDDSSQVDRIPAVGCSEASVNSASTPCPSSAFRSFLGRPPKLPEHAAQDTVAAVWLQLFVLITLQHCPSYIISSQIRVSCPMLPCVGIRFATICDSFCTACSAARSMIPASVSELRL